MKESSAAGEEVPLVDRECIPGCRCELMSLEEIRKQCGNPMEHMTFVYIGNITCSKCAHNIYLIGTFSSRQVHQEGPRPN